MAENENALIGDSAVVTWAILKYYHQKVKALFVSKEAGKGLSTNDLTNELKAKIDAIITDEGTEYVTTQDVDDLFEEEENDVGQGGGSDEEETLDAGAAEDEVSGGGADLDELTE